MTTIPTVNYGFSKIVAGTEKDVWGPIQSTTLDGIDTQIKNRQNEAAAKLPLAGGTLTGPVITPASIAGGAGIRIPHGVAPTAPVNGDFWSTSTAFFARLNGSTIQLATSNDLAAKANASHTHAQSDITGLVTDLAAKAPLAPAFDLKTVNYTLILTDAGKVIAMNMAGANTWTIPTNASVAFPIDTEIHGTQYGAGQTTVTPADGTVTIRAVGGKLKAAARYSAWTAKKINTNEWMVWGDLIA